MCHQHQWEQLDAYGITGPSQACERLLYAQSEASVSVIWVLVITLTVSPGSPPQPPHNFYSTWWFTSRALAAQHQSAPSIPDASAAGGAARIDAEHVLYSTTRCGPGGRGGGVAVQCRPCPKHL